LQTRSSRDLLVDSDRLDATSLTDASRDLTGRDAVDRIHDEHAHARANTDTTCDGCRIQTPATERSDDGRSQSRRVTLWQSPVQQTDEKSRGDKTEQTERDDAAKDWKPTIP
jgi:hypothetical protein